MSVVVNMEAKTLTVDQEITFYNQTNDTLTSIVLNDWNNAFSEKESPLGKRFSDEFYNKFHMALEEDRGGTINLYIEDTDKNAFDWERTKMNPDYVKVLLKRILVPNQKVKLHLKYISKIPSDKFTKYGSFEHYGMHLKNWFLTPSRYERHQFVQYSNENLDDIANAVSDFDIDLKIPLKNAITTDLAINNLVITEQETGVNLTGKNRADFELIIEKESSYRSYKIGDLEVMTNISSGRFNDSLKAGIIKRIVDFGTNEIGKYPYDKIIISEADYEKNPFYGLNQLPKFMRPFHTDFIFEIKFLKTYLNNYLKNSLQLDSRKDNWIYDGIQVFTMIKYIKKYHPESKMMGSASKYFLLKGFKMAQTDFNEQYSYYYMLMARKNLDQPLNAPKNKLIKYNVQIANKYKAGLSLQYLDDYLGQGLVSSGIQQFYVLNYERQTNRSDFENLLKLNSPKNIDWFFNYLIDSRENIDYKFGDLSKTKDSITFTVKNKGVPLVPMPIFGIKDKQIIFKKWLETNEIDTTLTLERKSVDKLVLNYKNEVPEFNLRNNWKSLYSFSLNRPLKLTFFQDLEDPHRSQLFYVPTLFYNKYDGFAPGINFYNYSFFDKPFMFSLSPMYSINTKSIVGSYSFAINQYLREGRLYNIRYSLNGSYYHYAPDAAYSKLYPSLSLYFREPSYRDNRKQAIFVKYNIINKEPSAIVIDSTDNYSILNLKYSNVKTEIASHVKFLADVQFSGYFGKASAEMEYRKLFKDKRYFNVRAFVGTFLYNTNDTQNYNFGVSRVNDYLFDYPLYARSDETGLLSQQYIMGQGGFKSFVSPSESNQWLVTTNLSYSLLWNWVDAYADFGFVKNKGMRDTLIYDSGIRLNLVQDYFELFFPVYSSNGFEATQKNYSEKIRFIFIFNPKSLINLFTRKWF
ncbi:aminopeptidase [Flavobacterium sp. NAS39]|uniref:Aminopeptidase n=2 Tax=Flavobacterium taihuense TaxID=2857508 RepID=A0ABS6Y036_9FLAO|nr:aminopeptidase [Flavobacterium taihuense]MBW4362285.1 aminopeptidase [Flavobacterium taihuense]